MANTCPVPKKKTRMRRVDYLGVAGREPALKAGTSVLPIWRSWGPGGKSRMVGLKALKKAIKKALYPALDVRYHSMIPANQDAMDMGVESVGNERG